MAPSLLVFTVLPCKSREAQQKAIEFLSTSAQAMLKNEPNNKKYGICTSSTDPDDLCVYMIEEFLSQADLDFHMSQDYTQNMFKWAAVEHPLSGEILLENYDIVEGCSLSPRPEVEQHKNCSIAFGTYTINEGTMAQKLQHWNDALSSKAGAADEGPLVFLVGQNKADPNKMSTVEAFKSREDAVRFQTTIGAQAEMQYRWLKQVGGYLYKE